MKKKVAKSYKLTLPKTYKTFYQKPTKNIDIYMNKLKDLLQLYHLKPEISLINKTFFYKTAFSLKIYDFFSSFLNFFKTTVKLFQNNIKKIMIILTPH